MDSLKARNLYVKHAAAVAYVEVESSQGDIAIGTAFHVGDGVFVTARHCVEEQAIREIRITEPVGVSSREFMPGLADDYYDRWDASLKEVMGRHPTYKHWLPPLQIDGHPIVHENPSIDLAIFRVKDVHHATPVVKLGIHWDDWVYRGVWQLSSAIVLGFPPIAMTQEPVLVAARGEIHTYVVPRHSPKVHFILSCVPRGGFSGGPAIHEDGFALGVVTSSLVRDGQPSELGFQAVLSIEPIREMLEASGMLPQCQREFADELMGVSRATHSPASSD